MKRIILSILAVAALASCSKTESAYVDQDQEIRLAPVTSMTTKAEVSAAIDGTAYPTGEHFDVYAYWANEPAGSKFTTAEANYLTAGTSGVEFVNKGLYWGGVTTYYWPKNGSLRFAAYSPADLDMTHELSTDVYTLSNLAYPTNTAETYEILVAPTSESYTAQTATEKVSVVFEHALSWLTIKVKSTELAKEVFTVKNVVVHDIKNNGTLTADMVNDTKTWALTEGQELKDINVYYEKTAKIGTDAQTLENTANGLLVLPQATTSVTLVFDQAAMEGTPALSDHTVTIPLILDGNLPWEPGKHYTYTVIFDLDEILINPSVEDWVDVEVPVMDASAIEVNNQVELISAVAAGKSVRLVNDIEITEPVVLTKGDVIVELNGKTITSTGDGFEVKGGTLSINGPGKVSAASNGTEPYCAVWAYGDAVVNIYGGEYEIGYPDGDYNDLIYAKENAVINVYGGKFYNSGKENAFVLNLKDPKDADAATAKINVYGGSYEKFNPANNLSEGANTNYVAAGYNVIQEGEWYTVYPSVNANIVLDEATTFVSSIKVNNGTLDGAGNTLTVVASPVNTADTYGIICPEGNVTVSNITIDGGNLRTSNDKGLRGIYVTKAGNYVYNNVTVKGVLYPIHVNTTQNVTLKVSNSALEGWLSYGTSTTADFTNVVFTKNNHTSYGMFRPYGTTVLTNCEFTNMEIDFGSLGENETITFIGCTINGVALKLSDLTIPAGKESLVTIK